MDKIALIQNYKHFCALYLIGEKLTDNSSFRNKLGSIRETLMK